jgi:hypothetical protein
VTGEITLIAIWVLQLGHVVGSRVVGLFTGIPFVRPIDDMAASTRLVRRVFWRPHYVDWSALAV